MASPCTPVNDDGATSTSGADHPAGRVATGAMELQAPNSSAAARNMVRMTDFMFVSKSVVACAMVPYDWPALVDREACDTGRGQTSSHSLRTSAFARRSVGVPSKTMLPWPIT